MQLGSDTISSLSHHISKETMANVENGWAILVEWLRDNFMTLNDEKCHHLVISVFVNRSIVVQITYKRFNHLK